MIPATKTVNAFDPVTGEQLSYGHWTPTAIEFVRLGSGMMAANIKLHRSRLLKSGDTELLPSDVAMRLAVVPELILTIDNIYAEATEEYPEQVRAMVLTKATPVLIGAIATLGYARNLL